MYEILLTDRALKSLKDIPKADVNAFEDYMDELWANDVVRQYEASENNTILYTMSDAKKILAV